MSELDEALALDETRRRRLRERFSFRTEAQIQTMVTYWDNEEESGADYDPHHWSSCDRYREAHDGPCLSGDERAAKLQNELDDALSVLRDLVALRPFMVADGFHEQARQLEAICRRARALVAEHPTNEETP